MSEVLRHEQLRATGTVVEVDDPEVGPTTQLGVTLRLVDTPGRVIGPRPAVGEHTDEVLAELASSSEMPSGHRRRACVGTTTHALGRHPRPRLRACVRGPFAAMVLGEPRAPT